VRRAQGGARTPWWKKKKSSNGKAAEAGVATPAGTFAERGARMVVDVAPGAAREAGEHTRERRVESTAARTVPSLS
jgi:hypothetical protein